MEQHDWIAAITRGLMGLLLGSTLSVAEAQPDISEPPPEPAPASATNAAAIPTAPPPTIVAKPAPRFGLKNYDDRDVRLADYEGRPVVVVFFATWDKFSREQMPILAEIQRKHADKGLIVMGISLDEAGPRVVRKFATDLKIEFPLLMFDMGVIEGFGGLTAIPTLFVIDRNHNIIYSHVGFTTAKVLEPELETVLKKNGE